MSEFIDIFMKFYVLGVGLLTPCFVPRGGVLYTIVPIGGFLLLSSHVPGICLIFIAHSLYRLRTRPGKSCQEPVCVPCLGFQISLGSHVFGSKICKHELPILWW